MLNKLPIQRHSFHLSRHDTVRIHCKYCHKEISFKDKQT
ncbi:hypothetical protein [uncultured Prevotella sp.]